MRDSCGDSVPRDQVFFYEFDNECAAISKNKIDGQFRCRHEFFLE
jgi:hypothetical protein